MSRKTLFAAGLCAAASLACASNAQALTAQFASADLDRWMYPFNFTPGSRSIGSLFGAVGNPGFDERDAQILAGFDTSSQVAPGLPASSYHITKVIVTATISGGSFLYDPTYDALATYLPGGVDADAGRPIELHGVGFRGGYTQLDFGNADLATGPGYAEAENFGDNNPTPGSFDLDRNAFPVGVSGGALVDVSNNVSAGFESNPWAIGTTSGVVPGSDVPPDTTFTFELDLSDPLVLAYLQSGLNAGQFGFILSSLHEASQTGPIVYPNIFLDEAPLGAPISLAIEYTVGQSTSEGVIPEPASLSLLALSLTLIARPMRRRQH